MARTPNKPRVPTRVIGSQSAKASRTAPELRPISSMPDIQGAIEAARRGEFSVTPLQLLGVILKSVLKKRITDEEVDRISTVYYDTIEKWWN